MWRALVAGTMVAAAGAPDPQLLVDHRARTLNFTAQSGRPMTDAQALREVRRGWHMPAKASDADVRTEIRRRTGGRQPRPRAPPFAPSRAAVASSGCGGTPPTSGQYTINITDPTLGPIVRVYHLHVPERYNTDAPTPLILDFHAWGWSSKDQLETTGMDVIADERTALVAYPEGYDDVVCPACDEGSYSWNACGGTTWRGSALGPTCQWELDPSIGNQAFPAYPPSILCIYP
jgi:hypothetical protein